MELERCPDCMQLMGNNEEKCPYCGFSLHSYEAKLHHLGLGNFLSGRYYIGKVIGEGGFGITYIGYDTKLDVKVAIKEFFPRNFVMRDSTSESGSGVVTFDAVEPVLYEKYCMRFCNEAKALAQFHEVIGLVNVLDYFMENGTAYIVMEYIDGQNFSAYIKSKGGRLGISEVLELLEPVVYALEELHKRNIIHRDISPENIMIDQKGRAILIDLGASREFGEKQESMSVLLKHGYAPLEQYSSKGKQGPYTDVYAFCATVYKAITGEIPLEVNARLPVDSLKKPSKYGIAIKDYQEAALLKGLSVYAKDRYASMEELRTDLYGQGKKKSKWRYKAACAVLAVFAAILFLGKMKSSNVTKSDKNNTSPSQNLEISEEKNMRPQGAFQVTENDEGKMVLDLSDLNLVDLNYLKEYDFSDVEELNLSGNPSLIDISGLEYLPNLKKILLENDTGIDDISVLEKLQKLEAVSLEGTGIRDISALSHIEGLQTLNLPNSIEDVTCLKNFENLKSLCMGGMISDFSFLADNKKLENLDISLCIAPLSSSVNTTVFPDLPKLKSLKTGGNFYLESLSQLPELTELFCYEGLKGFEAGKFPKLEKLSFHSVSGGLNGQMCQEINKCTNLKHISWSVDIVSDMFAQGTSETMKMLDKLDEISVTFAFYDTVKELPWEEMKSLKKLTLGLTDGVSEYSFMSTLLPDVTEHKSINLDFLNQVTTLEELHLDGYLSYNAIYSDISGCLKNKHLKKLSIKGILACKLSGIQNLDLEELTLLDQRNDSYFQYASDKKELKKIIDSLDPPKVRAPVIYGDSLEKLTLSLYQCNDFSGIGMNENLKELVLSGVSDVDKFDFLSELENLEVLSIQDCGLADFQGIGSLKNLRILSIPKAEIINTDFLKNLKRLERLDLSGDTSESRDRRQEIQNLDFMEEMENLKECNLSYRNIGNVSGLRSLKNLIFLNMEKTVFSAEQATFSDLKLLNHLLLTQDDKKNPSMLWISDLSNLEHLAYVDLTNCVLKEPSEKTEGFKNTRNFLASGTNLSSLEWMNHNEELRVIDISSTNVNDFMPLQDAKKIRKLIANDLYGGLSDLSPLQGTKDITWLEISGAQGAYLPLTDAEPLAENYRMTDLVLSRTGITDLNFLRGKKELTKLKLLGNKNLTDISGISGVSAVRRVNLNGCSILTDISPLAQLSELRNLNLGGCKSLKNLDGIKNMGKLRKLYCQNSGVENIDAVGTLEKLRLIDLSGTSLDTLSALEGKKSLKGVYLKNSRISSILPLKDCGLWCLDLTGTHISNLYKELMKFRKIKVSFRVKTNENELKNKEVEKLKERFKDGEFGSSAYLYKIK